MALSLIVVFIYGGLVWYVTPLDPTISWEGHLSGLISGLVLAFVFRKYILKPAKFEWESPDYKEEDDPFMKHFDENGNFIETLPEEDEEEWEYHYIYKEKNDTD